MEERKWRRIEFKLNLGEMSEKTFEKLEFWKREERYKEIEVRARNSVNIDGVIIPNERIGCIKWKKINNNFIWIKELGVNSPIRSDYCNKCFERGQIPERYETIIMTGKGIGTYLINLMKNIESVEDENAKIQVFAKADDPKRQCDLIRFYQRNGIECSTKSEPEMYEEIL